MRFLLGTCAVFAATSASAAVISLESFNTHSTGTANVDLTAGGTVDWVKFGANSNAIGSSIYASKDGGTAISGLTYIDLITPFDTTYGSGENAGRELADSRWSMFWSDGTGGSSPHGYGTRTETANSDFLGGGMPDLGEGFRLTVAASSTLPHTLTLYVANFETQATFDVTAPGATPLQYVWNNTLVGSGSVHVGGTFALVWTPDSASDVLTVEYWSTAFTDSASGGFANISVHGATLSAIPEPSTYAAMAGGIAMLALVMRRRRQ